MVVPCKNGLQLTGHVMDAISSLDHYTIPAELPSLRSPIRQKPGWGMGKPLSSIQHLVFLVQTSRALDQTPEGGVNESF